MSRSSLTILRALVHQEFTWQTARLTKLWKQSVQPQTSRMLETLSRLTPLFQWSWSWWHEDYSNAGKYHCISTGHRALRAVASFESG